MEKVSFGGKWDRIKTPWTDDNMCEAKRCKNPRRWERPDGWNMVGYRGDTTVSHLCVHKYDLKVPLFKSWGERRLCP